MRYILNSEGYICNVSFGADISCDLGNCTEYTGEIPADYETIDEYTYTFDSYNRLVKITKTIID